MKSDYNFSKAEQGKFYHPDATFHYPIDVEPDPSPPKHYPLRGMPITIAADFHEPMPELWDALEE
ncbi:hypothetical protein [Argonema galeatum]|uniref:hypothetical protein n=1 Tax=Argonema galeatum TaxID=2942762 RepID=UPI0020122DE4|nr:hypothetical protein [Argonema galeatum]MCL1467137.1 hypothetical protein [Argonema galeatum A003/A1]